jgi:hypothetical protein
MKNISALLLMIFLVGCASAYKPPQISPKPTIVSFSESKDQVFQKVISALLAQGYSIASSDQSLGIVSTQRRQMVLTPADADVGSTMGIDYLKDKRTTCFVTLTVQVEGGRVIIRSDIDAEYLPNDGVYGKRMTGVSRGTIERRLADAISN